MCRTVVVGLVFMFPLLILAADEVPDKVRVSMAAGDVASKLAPSVSPKGTQLPLEPNDYPALSGVGHLETKVKLGSDDRNQGELLVFARSAAGKPYDLLYLDANRDGKLDEKPLRITPNVVRGKIWSSFTATLTAMHRSGEDVQREDYPVSLWIVVEKEDERPSIVRYSRRGFLTGPAQIGTADVAVVLSDSDNNGQFGPGDWWGLRTADGNGDVGRTVGDFAWAGGRAWKLELSGPSGKQGQLVLFDPGITEEEDLIRRDRMREDRLAPRAAKPMVFRHDADAALGEVAGKSYFLKFETEWCGPCKLMTQWVFTAKDVAEAAEGITCIVVDGDARKDLVEKHAVQSYPTGILFGPDGREIKRYIGYSGVKQTAQFLKSAAK